MVVEKVRLGVMCECRYMSVDEGLCGARIGY